MLVTSIFSFSYVFITSLSWALKVGLCGKGLNGKYLQATKINVT